jgi:amino acid transporter
MPLKQALGTTDVVLLNVAAIASLRWISLTAASGNTSILLWLGALLLFFLPQAFAVIELTSRLPGEGGVYLWTKTAFGDFHGFMSGWCYWTNNLVYFPNLLVFIAGVSVFVAGSGYQEVGESRLYVLLFSLAALWTVWLFNLIGLTAGRWVHNVGGVGTWAAATILIVFGAVAVVRYGLANPMPPGSFFAGVIRFESLELWAAICFAFSGLELASVLAAEVRDAAHTIPRAVVISGFVVAALYVGGTLALLVALPAGEINIISGFLQGIAAIGDRIGLGWTTNVLALLITLGGIGGLMAWFTGAARMPFVAGVDRYLPQAFGRIHPRYGSPYVAVSVQAVIASGFILMSFVGATVQEAYLTLLDTTLLVYFIPYLYMFAAYVVLRWRDAGGPTGAGVSRESSGIGLTGGAEQGDALAPGGAARHDASPARTGLGSPDVDADLTSLVQRAAIRRIPASRRLAIGFGVCGLLTTLLAMAVSMKPPADTNALLYEIKVLGGAGAFVLSGAVIYWRNARRATPAGR